MHGDKQAAGMQRTVYICIGRGAGSTGAAGAAAPPALVARGQHGGSECPRHGDTTIALDHTASDTSLS